MFFLNLPAAFDMATCCHTGMMIHEILTCNAFLPQRTIDSNNYAMRAYFSSKNNSNSALLMLPVVPRTYAMLTQSLSWNFLSTISLLLSLVSIVRSLAWFWTHMGQRAVASMGDIVWGPLTEHVWSMDFLLIVKVTYVSWHADWLWPIPIPELNISRDPQDPT
jgi:hypothetical protein